MLVQITDKKQQHVFIYKNDFYAVVNIVTI